ncbi:MAG TPA: phospholipase D-like domain-containing protein [Gemmatimonadales bacterium]|nr:phospholipase D-like domain-containing protein [Gemmatimonadales bacterium]
MFAQPWVWQLVAGFLHVGLAIVVSAHIVLTKRDVRAAIGWIGLVWLAPVVGSALYGFFGINRIRRRAGRMRRGRVSTSIAALGSTSATLPATYPESLNSVSTLVGGLTQASLEAGNLVEPLVNGDQAYPAMLDAIVSAERSVALATYIFDRGRVGERFVDALGQAVRRGVQVRVLIDGVGARYSRPPIVRTLRRRGVTVAQFLRSRWPLPQPYLNLRNHRKLLVVDGKVGFCGGMNIRDGHALELKPRDPTQDIHFRVHGPVVRQLMTALAFDWTFATGEALAGPEWYPALEPAGDVLARGIPDGPDEDFETLLLTLLGALAQARESLRIVTPYFLPDHSLLEALRVAALRGVRIDIVLPSRGNLRLVQWAATAQLARVIQGGCRVFLTPPPFDHSKLFVVDGAWSLIGSANWDPRSLRLNFEYGVECYSQSLAATLDRLIEAKIASARRLTLEDLDQRSLAVKLRDGVAWLAQPYL